MLTHLSIRHYTVVDQLELEFRSGMTVITGETGAGKSIMLDALGLCLGDRADPKAIRPGCERAEITASFDIGNNPSARAWLAERELLHGDDCLLRRVVTGEGRSRAWINGSPATIQDCASLGQRLVDIHSQHAHQSLLRRRVQRDLLDSFAGQEARAREVADLAREWTQTREARDALRDAREEQDARAQLLAYQVGELEELGLAENELEQLETDQRQLANAEEILQAAHQALALCEEPAGAIRQARQLLSGRLHSGKTVDNARELLESVGIQLDEAQREIQRHIDGVELEPERLAAVEQRLAQVHDIARKHRVRPEELPALTETLRAELDELGGGDERLASLEATLEQLADRYRETAAQLGKARRKSSAKLEKQVTQLLGDLAMSQCRFQVALHPRESTAPHPQGLEDVEFLVSTNPGAEPQPLGRIASGGELSRISLAIQVATASHSTLPSMVFDEVDVGIGGAVAEVVGRLLRTLARDIQVLCVTHLPQVAAQGDQHLQVSKTVKREAALTQMAPLDGDERTREIARMLGGVKITEQSLAHAREMLGTRDVADA
ncbi:MAG: DNA repair protein RecN [Haliea sp.]|nr:DNA repair protein RecN [Haliea sp.]